MAWAVKNAAHPRPTQSGPVCAALLINTAA
jgi:hypothetical protein